MWEVFTAGDTPYREMTRNADVAEYVTQKRRTLNRPNACPNPIYQNIMSRCWAYVSILTVHMILIFSVVYKINKLPKHTCCLKLRLY